MLEERVQKLEKEVVALHFKNTVNLVYILSTTILTVGQYMRK